MNALGPERLDAILDRASEIYRDRLALLGGGEYTYGQMATRAEAIRDELLTRGLAAGEPVVLMVGNTAHDIVAFYGVWKAGGVAVPLHTKAAQSTSTDVIERTGARFILRGSESTAFPSEVDDGSDRLIIALERAARPQSEILRDACLVIFTSGSTGRPKGVVLSHRAFATKLCAIQSVIPFRETASTLLILQLTFSFGQWVSLLTLATGGTLHLLPKFEPVSSLLEVAEHRIKRVAAVPTMMRAWQAAEADGSAASVFQSLEELRCPELIIAGGEPLSAALGGWFRKRLPASALTDVFGLTETSTSDFILPPEKYDLYPGTIGFPTPGVSFRLGDADEGPTSVGLSGELRIHTPHIMNGYLDDPQTTAAAFDGEYLRTGDLAQLTESGALMLVGRQKEIIVRGGNKISPLEVERAFADHPQVAAVLATGMPDELLGEKIHLLVVPQQDAQLTEEELRHWAVGRLDKFKIPDRIHFGAELPLGRTGKADRQALRRLISETT